MTKTKKIIPRRPLKRRLIKFFAVLLIVVAVPVLLGSVYFSRHEIGEVTEYNWNPESDAVEGRDYLTISADKDEFRILQLSDLHLTFGGWPGDSTTFKFVNALISETKPDLVVFTGDVTMTIFNSRMFELLGEKVMSKFPDVYWTFAFGNHDTWGKADKAKLCNILDGFDNCMFLSGATNLGGEGNDKPLGNFAINIEYEDNFAYSVIIMDSGRRSDYGYGYVTETQVKWYEWIAGKLHNFNPNLKSSLFMHIPLFECKESYEKNGVTEGVKSEKINVQGCNTGLYAKAVSLNFTEFFGFGHDHKNTFSTITEDGIMLAYGGVSGFLAYGFNFARCGRIIDVDLSSGSIFSSGIANTKIITTDDFEW